MLVARVGHRERPRRVGELLRLKSQPHSRRLSHRSEERRRRVARRRERPSRAGEVLRLEVAQPHCRRLSNRVEELARLQPDVRGAVYDVGDTLRVTPAAPPPTAAAAARHCRSQPPASRPRSSRSCWPSLFQMLPIIIWFIWSPHAAKNRRISSLGAFVIASERPRCVMQPRPSPTCKARASGSSGVKCRKRQPSPLLQPAMPLIRNGKHTPSLTGDGPDGGGPSRRTCAALAATAATAAATCAGGGDGRRAQIVAARRAPRSAAAAAVLVGQASAAGWDSGAAGRRWESVASRAGSRPSSDEPGHTARGYRGPSGPASATVDGTREGELEFTAALSPRPQPEDHQRRASSARS